MMNTRANNIKKVKKDHVCASLSDSVVSCSCQLSFETQKPRNEAKITAESKTEFMARICRDMSKFSSCQA